MNRDSNSYTLIYAAGLVILVAVLLASASVLLKDSQDSNIEIAKKSDILKSVGIESDASTAVDLYDQFVKESYVVNVLGNKVDGVAFDVSMIAEVKKLTDAKKLEEEAQKESDSAKAKQAKQDLEAILLPVYVCQLKDGTTKFILPVRGKGLWGPVWGYVAMNQDKVTIFGATFGHKSETPGLGAEISKDAFQLQFKSKKIMKDDEIKFQIAKGGAKPGDDYAVDAISGGTITSKGVEAMLVDCLDAYSAFLKK